jgi:hypothetical protein
MVWKLIALLLVLATLAVQVVGFRWLSQLGRHDRRREQDRPSTRRIVLLVLVLAVELPLLLYVLLASPVGRFLDRNQVARAGMNLGVAVLLAVYLRRAAQKGRQD